MSEETITYDDDGGTTVSFGGGIYRLRPVDFGPWRTYTNKLQALYADNRETLKRLTEEAAKEGKGQVKAQAALHEYQMRPFYEATIPWLKEAFKEFGDTPLPEDEGTWPAWLAADLTLPTQITNHWKTTPKASGPTNSS